MEVQLWGKSITPVEAFVVHSFLNLHPWYQKFQHLEEERINFLKESLSQFAYLQMTYAQAQTARWEGLTTLVNSWDCREELDTYVGDQGTGRDIPGTYGVLVHNIQAGHHLFRNSLLPVPLIFQRSWII
jgi:hypothetical protein